jgi:fatty-acid desaturase
MVRLVYYGWFPTMMGVQITMLVNSAVHLWGDEPFPDAMSAPCTSKNTALLFFPMLGENWHNNHHGTLASEPRSSLLALAPPAHACIRPPWCNAGAPNSATTWVEWYQVDCQWLAMKVLEKFGLVTDIQVRATTTTCPSR